MTFVGKILVCVIMAFSLFFLAFSTVVFMTEENWKEEVRKRKEEVTKLNTSVQGLRDEQAKAKAENAAAKAQYTKDIALVSDQIKGVKAESDTRQKEIEDQRKAVEVAQENARQALAQSESRTKETGTLRDTLKAVQDQANEYKLRQTELNDQIRILKRQLDTAVKNNADLRERVAVFQQKLTSLGQSADFATLKGVTAPPDVEGEVDKVDSNNRRVEITIGSDDGLVVGHELHLYRLGPEPKYLGKVKIISVDPDRAVAEVIGKTNRGEKIQEHDIVATKIRSRG